MPVCFSPPLELSVPIRCCLAAGCLLSGFFFLFDKTYCDKNLVVFRNAKVEGDRQFSQNIYKNWSLDKLRKNS